MDLIERALKKQQEAKKQERVSLVERAAAKSQGSAPKRGIGQRRPDSDKTASDKQASDNQASESEETTAASEAGSADSEAVHQTPEGSETGSEKPAEKKRSGIGSAAARTRDPSSLGPSEVKSSDKTPATDQSEKAGPEPRRGIGMADKLAEKGVARTPQRRPELASFDEKPKPAGAEVTGVTPPARPAGDLSTKEIDLVALRDAGYITPDMPPNLMSEEFRIIKRSLVLNAFARGDDALKNGNVMLVTSSNPSEGKTFCAINLALSIATEQDVTVLLIDADFSKPEVLNRLGVSGGKGLMDVVADKKLDLGDCLIRTNIENLVLLPAGRQHNLTTELLASDRMKDLVNELSTRYPDRIIIFDSPPVLASSAASVMALYMGQTVFVIEAERTTEPQIKESLNLISGCKNISLLLNKTQFGSSEKKFATYYGYGGR